MGSHSLEIGFTRTRRRVYLGVAAVTSFTLIGSVLLATLPSSSAIADEPAATVAPVTTSDTAASGAASAAAATTGTSSTITVTKMIVPNGGSIDDAVAATQPWEYTVAVQDGADITVTGDSYQLTSATDNSVAFEFEHLNGALSGGVNIHEYAAYGSEIVPVAGQNAVCVVAGTGDAVAVTSLEDNGFTVSTVAEQVISCTVYGTAPALVPSKAARAAGDLTVALDSNPASGTDLVPGEAITYTATYTNTLSTALPVNASVSLIRLTDDADMTTDPALTSGTGVTVAMSGTLRVLVQGTLAAGATAVVTFTMTVKPGMGGDGLMTGWASTGTGTAPTNCAANSDEAWACVEHKAETTLDITTTEVPAAESAVLVGETITYTVKFTNTGSKTVEVSYYNQATDFQDDVTWDNSMLSYSGGVTAAYFPTPRYMRIVGSVAPGQTGIVTYGGQVTSPPTGNGKVRIALGFSNLPTISSCTPGADPRWLCIQHQVLPRVSVAKSSVPAPGEALLPGDLLTYTVTLTNNTDQPAAFDYTDMLASALDDGEWVGPATANGVTDFVASPDTPTANLTLTGTVAAGATATVTYGLKIKDIGSGEANVFTRIGPTGAQTNGSGTCTVDGPFYACTSSPVLNPIVAEKISDPATGVEVVPGTEISYTLTLTNTNDADLNVFYRDTLTNVVDDATITAEPVVNAGSNVAVTLYEDGTPRIDLIGTMVPGEVATVTYSVIVDAATTGNGNILNVFGLGARVAPAACTPGGTALWECTQHTVERHVTAAKRTVPESGLPVARGTNVRYALNFTNEGDTPEAIDYTDYLGDVLDDAEWTADPAPVQGLNLVIDPDTKTMRVTGTVPANTLRSVYYDLRATGLTEGDGTMLNVLAATSPTPPTMPVSCLPGDEVDVICTQHQIVDSFTLTKVSEPESGTAVFVGDEITYTVTASSTDSALSDIVLTDDLTGLVDGAEFVAGSAQYTVGDAAPIAVDDPTGTDTVLLTTPSINLEPNQTATLTYRVTVTSWATTLTNVVDGVGEGGVGPISCAPCSTTHWTDTRVEVLKTGESTSDTWVPMAGSEWKLLRDVNDNPGTEYTAQTVEPVDGETGLFEIAGLPHGTYWLTETKAPAGFSLLAEPVQFIVDEDGAVTLWAGVASTVSVTTNADSGSAQINVRDVPAMAMPEAGSTGTLPYNLAGIALVLLSAALFIGMRRRGVSA